MSRPRSARASGSVYRQKGARGEVWRAKIRLPDGRQLHRRIGPAWNSRGRPAAGTYTKRGAEGVLREWLRQADEGTLPGIVRTDSTVNALADDYLEHLERDRATKPSTLRDYRSILAAHVRPVLGETPPEELTPEMVERWQRRLTSRRPGEDGKPRPLSARTRQKALVLLHGLMQHAVARHRLPSNPVADVAKPRAQRRAGIEVLSVEEVQALVRAAADAQDAAIYLTAALTGLRRGELIALRWRDVDFAGSSVRVERSYAGDALTSPKSHQGRTVPMAPEVAASLARLSQRDEHTQPDDLVFAGAGGSYLDASALRRRYKKALNAASLRQLRFHDLRHTFGTRLAASGVDLWRVQHWMGHAAMATTAIYAHYSPRAADAALVADAFAAEKPAERGAESPT